MLHPIASGTLTSIQTHKQRIVYARVVIGVARWLSQLIQQAAPKQCQHHSTFSCSVMNDILTDKSSYSVVIAHVMDATPCDVHVVVTTTRPRPGAIPTLKLCSTMRPHLA